MNVWTYVITHDDGGAPNFEPPWTTLTVCKPRIRKRARLGALVLAFNGARLNPTEPHSVRWAGIVSKVIPLRDCWNDPRFEGKKPGRQRGQRELPDNIYRPTTVGGLEQVENKTHTPAATARDVGGVNALVLQSSWYLGLTVATLPEHFKLRMAGGRRGERRSEISEATWHELKQWLDDNAPDISAVELPVDGAMESAPQHVDVVAEAPPRRSRRAAISCG
jgi:Nucleotide modification associated domain 2